MAGPNSNVIYPRQFEAATAEGTSRRNLITRAMFAFVTAGYFLDTSLPGNLNLLKSAVEDDRFYIDDYINGVGETDSYRGDVAFLFRFIAAAVTKQDIPEAAFNARPDFYLNRIPGLTPGPDQVLVLAELDNALDDPATPQLLKALAQDVRANWKLLPRDERTLTENNLRRLFVSAVTEAMNDNDVDPQTMRKLLAGFVSPLGQFGLTDTGRDLYRIYSGITSTAGADVSPQPVAVRHDFSEPRHLTRRGVLTVLRK